MGARAARITREELLTPPEFRDLAGSAHHPAARIGGARIELVRSPNGETRLGACYQQIPVRVMPAFPISGEPASLVYLINLTAGLMDGDGHLVEVEARARSSAVITGQSATRVHPALAGYATQQWSVNVEDEACLVVLPGPVIPFRGSRYFQRGRVNLAATSRLIWGDIWLAGRYDRGELSEHHQFDKIVQDFEVERAGRLVYRERFRWDGPWSQEEAGWYWGNSLACAGLLVAGPIAEVRPLFDPELTRSAFALDSGNWCVRWIGRPAAVTLDVAETALQIAGVWTGGAGAPPWLLTSTDLAPNHWFIRPGGMALP